MESRRDNDIKQRKDLNADTLFSLIRSSFENVNYPHLLSDESEEGASFEYFHHLASVLNTSIPSGSLYCRRLSTNC